MNPVPDITPEQEPSDADLVRRIHLGEAVLFGVLVERYRLRLFRFASRILYSRHDAEDACQNTFVKVWRHLRRYDCSRAFSTWIFTIAYRESCTLLARRRHEESTLPEIVDDTAGVDDTATQRDDIHHVWQTARRMLAPKIHHLLWLHYGEDMPLGEIARVTGRTLVSVKVSLFRARQKLARELGTAGVVRVAAAKPQPDCVP